MKCHSRPTRWRTPVVRHQTALRCKLLLQPATFQRGASGLSARQSPFRDNLALPQKNPPCRGRGTEVRRLCAGSGGTKAGTARIVAIRPDPERHDENIRCRQVFWLSDRPTGRAFSSPAAKLAL